MSDFHHTTQAHTNVIKGRDHLVLGQVDIVSIPEAQAIVGISVGKAKPFNEDAAAITMSGDDTVIAIADGHWGDEASNLAIDAAASLLQLQTRNAIGNEARARLITLFEYINRSLLKTALEAPGSSVSETTLIVCYIHKNPSGVQLYWASFGDSYLFVQRKGSLQKLNTLKPCWLGALSKLSEQHPSKTLSLKYRNEKEDQYVGVLFGIESGIENLESGSTLLLCTDGLVDSIKTEDDSYIDDIQTIIASSQSIEKKCRRLITVALEAGGKDNITCLIAEV